MEIYDPDAGSFTAIVNPNSTQVFDDGLPTASLLLNGKALVAGGADVQGLYASADSYDSSTGTFTRYWKHGHRVARKTQLLCCRTVLF